MDISLIANTGIQFFTTEFETKPEDSFVDKSGNMLLPLSIMDENNYAIPYAFHESFDPLTGYWKLELVVSFPSGQCVRLEELKQHDYPSPYIYTDVNGVDRVVDESQIDFSELDVLPADECYSDYCLAGSIREKLAKPNYEYPLDAIEGQWLPMPFFEQDMLGNVQFGPVGWCRMKLALLSCNKNVRRYRVVWAFDTTAVSNDLSTVRPFFYEGDLEKRYALCDNVPLMFDFFSPQPYGCEWVDDYIASLIHGDKSNSVMKDPDSEVETHFKYLSYYITFICYFRKMGLCPNVTLYTSDTEHREVDLVLDIGNSRTCGVLFENSDFTKVEMLQLQDLSEPWRKYQKPFDMRLAFHHAKFGEMDIPGQFEWQSFLRVGDEAIKLIYQSRPSDGVSVKTTNYSSPKRYLWDNKKFSGQWDFLTTSDSASLTHYINIKGLSEQLADDGSLRTSGESLLFSSFSRRSLMTFVMIEILQQAKCQINSFEFRKKHGDVDLPRKLKRILVTCPTAMPKEEQIALRKCAEDAYIMLLRGQNPDLYCSLYDPKEWEGKVHIVPSVKDLTANTMHGAKKLAAEWGYDEATCCQLVYLYAEIAQRYMNHCEDFFNLYGHVRHDLDEEWCQKKTLTVGSLDIGAGTTDLMICTYKYDEGGVSKLTPQPLFWDSFYYAGDDLLEEIVRLQIIEGLHKNTGTLNCGPIFNAVCSAYMSLSDEDFVEALDLKNKIRLEGMSDAEKHALKYSAASRETSERIHNFFGRDKALMDYKTRLMREDFNVQVSVPMGLKLLDLFRLGRKDMQLKFDDFFPELKPAEYILKHFTEHFSLVKNKRCYVNIDFKNIVWEYNPQDLSEIIISKLEPLMKQLAVVMSTFQCDVILLAGKPMSLSAITDLFLKYYPISPNRLIRLNDYRVGEWYPFSDGLGYFKDQKSLVAVGAMIGYMASNGGLGGFHMDMSAMKKEMASTAKFMGLYNSVNQKITDAIISPEQNTASFEIHGFPLYLGCKQLVSQYYQARPLYAITLADDVDLHTVSLPLKMAVSRNYSQDREMLKIVSVVDSMGRPFPLNKLKFNVQSLADEGTYWLDKGEFVLSING